MTLTILERIMVVSMLPEKGSRRLVEAIEKFRNEIKFNEEETRNYDISQRVKEGGLVEIQFNQEVAEGYEKDIKVPPILSSFIAEKLKKMDKDEQVDNRFLSLFEKFVV